MDTAYLGNEVAPDFAALQGVYLTCFVCALLLFFLFFFFLAQLAAMKHQLKAAQDAAAGSSSDSNARVERPDKIKNLQEAMGLTGDSETYRSFCVSLFCFL